MARFWCLIVITLIAVASSSLAQNISRTFSEPPELTNKQDDASQDAIKTAKIFKTVSAALAVAFIATFGLAPCTFAFLFGCIGFTKSGN